ncbi:chemotaxis protein CheW [Fundidesulfovibrio butyratiphilus]
MTDEANGKTLTSLSFVLDKELFALDINNVREILDFTEITRIPQTPEYMRGVVNLRGNAIPVVDLRLKFGMGRTEQTIYSRIIILEVPLEDEVVVVGVMADAVKEVFEMERDQIKPPPKMGAAVRADLLKGIGRHRKQFIMLLDVNKVFSDEDLCAATQLVSDVPVEREDPASTPEADVNEPQPGERP